MFNVVSSSHKTTFHAQSLHLIHVMQTRNPHFCMVSKLLEIVAIFVDRVSRRQKTQFYLPIPITKIIGEWTGGEIFIGDFYEK